MNLVGILSLSCEVRFSRAFSKGHHMVHLWVCWCKDFEHLRLLERSLEFAVLGYIHHEIFAKCLVCPLHRKLIFSQDVLSGYQSIMCTTPIKLNTNAS